MRVEYQQLPWRIQDAVDKILAHRKGVNKNASYWIPMNLFGASWLAYDLHSESKFLPISLVMSAFYGIAGAGLFKSHRPTYRKEYLELFQALKSDRKRKPIRKLLGTKNAHFLCVNRDGSIETREKMPKQIFKLPIGRRVVVNPRAPTEKILKWKRSLPATRKRKPLHH